MNNLVLSCHFLVKMTALCCFLVFFSGCTATISRNGLSCDRISETSMICKDRVHPRHCRLHIDRQDPYPDTVTDVFLCADSGFLGYSNRKDTWTEGPGR